MSDAAERLLFVREFLNKPGFESTGFVFTEVTEDETWLSLTIGDCSRQISLTFNLGSEGASDNSFYKIDLLIDTLKQFRKAAKVCDRNARKRRAERERLSKTSREAWNREVLDLPETLAEALRATEDDEDGPPFGESVIEPARRRPRRR